jgi:ribosomal protein L19
MEQKKNYTLPIIMMFLLFAMISFVTGLSNPLGVIVKNQFAVANWMSQLGNFANFIAYAVMGIPAGMMLKRIGYKKTALAAVAIGFVGVGIQYLSGEAGSFPIYLIGAFVSGFSMCMLNTVVNPMLNTLGGGGKKGNQLIQFGGSLNSISATIVPVLVGYLMGNAANATISGAAGMLGAKHIKFVATMNKDAIIKLVNEQMWAKTDADVPSFKAGDTITVSYKIIEGNKERVQSFRGVVIQIKGSGKTKMFTIRKVSNGVGVERIFPLYSPHIDKIEVNKIGVVRRARIYYLRDLTGKKARIKEKRMTSADKK